MTWTGDLINGIFSHLIALDLLLHVTLKSTLVLAIGLLVAGLAMRRSAAAARHLAWVLTFLVVATSPVLVRLLPIKPMLIGTRVAHDDSSGQNRSDDSAASGVSIAPGLQQRILPPATMPAPQLQQQLQQTLFEAPAPPNAADTSSKPAELVQEAEAQESQAARAANLIRSVQPKPEETAEIAATTATTAETQRRASWLVRLREWAAVLFGIWFAGVCVSCGFLVYSHLQLKRLQRRFRPVLDGRLFAVLRSLVDDAGIRREVSLHISDHQAMPMTWGVLKPGIVLPASAQEWSDKRLRIVLLHEVAHVQRLDCLWQTLALVTVAIHWFNPLVWVAASRLRSECELACDDVVLSNGVSGPDYAEQLLDISTGGNRGVIAMCAGMAMARSHRLTGRLQAIIDLDRNRSPVSQRVFIMFVTVAAMLTVPMTLLTHVTLDAGETEILNSNKRIAAEAGATGVAEAAPFDARVLADQFHRAMTRKGYSFLSSQELARRRDEVEAFVSRHLDRTLNANERRKLQKGIDRCIDRLYSTPAGTVSCGNGFGSGGEEWMYLCDRDFFRTFQYHLWVGLTHRARTGAEIRRRDEQQKWMRDHLAGLPFRGRQESVPVRGMKPEAVRPWVLDRLEQAFDDPLHLLSLPMTDASFRQLQERFKKINNGLVSTLGDMEVAALTSRFSAQDDPGGRYGRTYSGTLPFKDVVVNIWGNAPHLVFESNADFFGHHGFLLTTGKSVYDVVGCREMVPPHDHKATSNQTAEWLTKEQRGELACDQGIVAVRGTMIAKLDVKNWFESDKLSDVQLKNTMLQNGTTRISDFSLPLVNGIHKGDRSEGEFFMVVQNPEGRLAVLNLHNEERNMISFWCRPRPLIAKNVPKHAVHEKADRAARRQASDLSVDIDYFTQLTIGFDIEPSDAFASVTIANRGKQSVPAPDTWWSMRAIVDGKPCEILPQYRQDWSGAGEIIAGGKYRSVISLREFGIAREKFSLGWHTFQIRIGNATSNTLVFIGGPSPPAGSTTAACGDEVEGVRARLRLPTKSAESGMAPTLIGDVVNQGDRTFGPFSPRQQLHEIEIDGVWYRWSDKVRVLAATSFPPDTTHNGIEFTLAGRYWASKPGRAADGNASKPLELAPGKHTARVAFLVDEGRVRAVSNKVEFEIHAEDAQSPERSDPNTNSREPESERID